MKVSGKILPGSVRVSVMAEGQRPRKTKRKREKATPVNAEIQAAVEKERHAQSIARAKRNIVYIKIREMDKLARAQYG